MWIHSSIYTLTHRLSLGFPQESQVHHQVISFRIPVWCLVYYQTGLTFFFSGSNQSKNNKSESHLFNRSVHMKMTEN